MTSIEPNIGADLDAVDALVGPPSDDAEVDLGGGGGPELPRERIQDSLADPSVPVVGVGRCSSVLKIFLLTTSARFSFLLERLTSAYPVSAEESLQVEVVDEDSVADAMDDHTDWLGEVGQLQKRLDRLRVGHHVYVLIKMASNVRKRIATQMSAEAAKKCMKNPLTSIGSHGRIRGSWRTS